MVDEFRRARADRRDLSAARAAGGLLRPRSRRRAPAVQFPADAARRGSRATIAQLIDEYEAALPAGGWPNWVLGNHDKPRIASRVGADQARVAAMLLLTLRGTPTLYYGDEIGMPTCRSRPTGAGSVREEQAGLWARPRSRAHADAMGRRRVRWLLPPRTVVAPG